MGIYNTCHFGCTYCYANFSDGMIENNRSKHQPDSPSLLGRCDRPIDIQTSLKKPKCSGCQLKLL
jgi:DNA repair photolyase